MAFVKIVNAEGGSDARYDVSQATPEERAQLDPEGRPLSSNLPDQWSWTPGLPGARGGTGPGFDQGVAGAPGAVGDLASSAMSSPFYQQALAATQAAGAADAANRKAAIQQMLVQFGLVPQNFTDPYGDVDQTTRDLASQNTSSGISVAARLKQALQDAQRESGRRLAARGLRRSGARGFQMRKNQLGYDQQYSDAVNQLLGGARNVYSGFGQAEYGRSMSLAQALQNAVAQMSAFSRPSFSSFSAPSTQAQSAPSVPAYYNFDPGAPGTPTIGGGTVGQPAPNISLGGGSGTSSKKPLLF